MRQDRLYLVAPIWTEKRKATAYGYYPGILPDGTQVLMFRGNHGNFALCFTGDGWLREVRTRPCDVSRPEYSVQQRRELVAQAVFAWQDEIAFQPARISVHQFSIDRPVRTYIADPPGFVEDWSEEDLADWQKRQCFVLYLEHGEHILNGEGNPSG